VKTDLARIQFFAPDLLGRHVGESAHRGTQRGESRLAHRGHRRKIRGAFCRSQLGQPKIQNLGVPALGHKYVGSLDIAVDDFFCMPSIQRVRNLDSEAGRLLLG
jgi:hypothetical protein